MDENTSNDRPSIKRSLSSDLEINDSKCLKKPKIEDIPNDQTNKCNTSKLSTTCENEDNLRRQRKRKRFYYLDDTVTKPRKLKVNTKYSMKNVKIIQSDVCPNQINKLMAINKILSSSETPRFSYEMLRKQDLYFYVFDEIALEGLDGITINAFWKRLENAFPNKIPSAVANRVWSLLRKNEHLEFFTLEEPRGEMIPYSETRCSNSEFDEDMDFATEIPEIYPYTPINSPNIKGSCSTFLTRKKLESVHKLSLQEVIDLYGQKLVIVADQASRNKAIFAEESDPNFEITDVEYFMLERIGRSRTSGELAAGKMSLAQFFNDSKSTFHHRKSLSSQHMLSIQSLNLKSQLFNNRLVCLLHLPRFYCRHKSKTAGIMEKIANAIKCKPNFLLEYRELRQLTNANVKILVKQHEFNKFFKTSIVSYRSVYPDATKKEYMYKSGMGEKYLKIVQLVDPFVNVVAKCYKEKDVDENEVEESTACKLHFYPFIEELYSYILSKGVDGVTMHEILVNLQSEYYTTRMALRRLQSRNLLDLRRIDVGRQQSAKFSAKCLRFTDIQSKPKTQMRLKKSVLEKILKDHPKNLENIASNSGTIAPRNFLEDIRPTRKYIKHHFYERTANFNIENQLLISSNTYETIPVDIEEKFSIFLKNRVTNPLQVKTDKGKFKLNFTKPMNEMKSIDYLSKAAILNVSMQQKSLVLPEIEKFSNICNDIKFIKSNDIQVQKMKKYMGNDPLLIFNGSGKYAGFKMFLSTLPKSFINNPQPQFHKNNATKRFNDRANMIIRVINEEKIINCFHLLRIIRKEELKLGYGDTICYKSMERILVDLVTGGYLKIYQLFVNVDNVSKTVSYICKNDTVDDDIKNEFDNLKISVFSGKTLKPVKKTQSSPFSSLSIKESARELNRLAKLRVEKPPKFISNLGRTIGYRPKYLRMRILHEFLFYLIYVLPRDAMSLRNQDIYHLCNKHQIEILQEEIEEMPPVYGREISWKMFVVPLSEYTDFPNGWIFGCDILMRLPLSVYLKIHNFNYELPELNEYLKHPIKRHYLIKDMPVKIASVLYHKKKCFTSLLDNLYNMAYIGLVQFGPRKSYDRIQIFAYLNRRAILYDTTTSNAGYNRVEVKKYKKLTFEFTSSDKVELYWHQMWKICMGTSLGKRSVMDGKNVLIENPNFKPVLMKTLKWKSTDVIVSKDKGYLPGDRMGGAGLDSSLWSCVKRNWLWNTKWCKKTNVHDIEQYMYGLRKEKLEDALPKPIKYGDLIKLNFAETVVCKTPPKPATTVTALRGVKKRRKVILRKIVLRKTRRVREYYDWIDKAIMKRNNHERVNWEPDEDEVLRLSRIASTFICLNVKKQFICFNVIRDVLHRLSPKSFNKTSRACQRRLTHLLNEDTLQTMEYNVNVLLQMPMIAKYFSQICTQYRTNQKLNESEINVAYVYLMSYLHKNSKEVLRLLQGHSTKIDLLAKSSRLLFEHISFYLDDSDVYYRNPQTVPDIKKDTIRSIIQNSLNCRQTTRNWNRRLYDIYLDYSDEALRDVINYLKKSQIITTTKSKEDTPIEWTATYNSMFASPTYSYYYFKELYKSILNIQEVNKNFLVLNDLYAFYTDLELEFDIPDMVINLNPSYDDHSEMIDEISRRFHRLLERIHEKMIQESSAVTIAVDEPKACEDYSEIKNYVMGLVFRVPYLVEGKLETHFKRLMDSENDNEINESLISMFGELKESAKIITTDEEILKFIDQIGSDLVGNSERIHLKLALAKYVFAIQNTIKEQYEKDEESKGLKEKFELFCKEIGENFGTKNPNTEEREITKNEPIPFIPGIVLDNKNMNNGMNACIRRAMKGEIPQIEEIKTGIMCDVDLNENRIFPHVTDLSLLLAKEQFPEFDTDEENIEKMRDHFIIHYPNLLEFRINNFGDYQNHPHVKFLSDKNHEEKIQNVLKKFSVVKEPNEDILSTLPFDSFEMDFLRDVIDFIVNKGAFGATGEEIKNVNGNQFILVDLLASVIESGLIVKTGITNITFVHHLYAESWLVDDKSLDMFKGLNLDNTYYSNRRHIQLKPWINLDGTINLDVFKNLSVSILSVCLDYPNITFPILCEKFPYLKPVDIYFILEILQEIGCIRIWTFDKNASDLLFSEYIIEEREANILDNIQDLFVKVSSSSGICIGKFFDVCSNDSINL